MVVIVYGPPGSGKSQHAEALQKHYKCSVIQDNWTPGEPQLENALILTQAPMPEGIAIADALEDLRGNS